MADRAFNDVQFLVAEAQRLTSFADRVGVIFKVDKDKVRVVLGVQPDGTPFLSPWLHTTNMRGGATERRAWKKGQSCRVSCPGGDIRQATVTHAAPNDKNKAPKHADAAGDGAETYELGALRVTKKDGVYDIWLAEGDATGAFGPSKMKLRINKDGGVTGRVGKMRFAAHEKGAKIKANKDFVAVVDGVVITSKPPIVGGDPFKDDDE